MQCGVSRRRWVLKLRNLVYHSTDKNKGTLRIIAAIDALVTTDSHRICCVTNIYIYLGKLKARISSTLSSSRLIFPRQQDFEFYGPAYDLGGCNVPKMRFLATLRRTTFYISLSRGSAVGTLLNIALLASMISSNKVILQTGKLYPVPGPS